MKLQIVLLICLTVSLTSVLATDYPSWSEQKCGIDNQKVYDRSLNFDTCNDLCVARNARSGSCVLHNGYGECQCITRICTSGVPGVGC